MTIVEKQRRHSQLEDDLPIIKQLYCKYKKDTYDIGEIFGRSPSHIRYLLLRDGIKLRRKTLQYTMNENFFSKIDNKIKAYWFGFLCADGHNAVKTGCVSILLSLKDINILKAFKRAIRFSGLIRYRTINLNAKPHQMCYLQIYSRKISHDLEVLGCGNQKSLTLQFPKLLSDELMWHFIRGYFDGDGHIFKNKYAYSLDICCSKNFAIELKFFLHTNNIYCYIYKNSKRTINQLRINRKQDFFKFCELLYNDSKNLRLNRKY